MALFPKVTVEPTVRLNDKTRIDGSRSYVSPDESDISLIEIQPAAGESFISVTDVKYLDWEYTSAGDKVVTVRITSGASTATTTATISALAAADDIVFSTDADLVRYESDIMSYLPDDHSSFIYLHREARNHILREFVRRRLTESDGTKIAANDIADDDQVKDWSIYYVLHQIYQFNIQQEDDFFAAKSEFYRQRMEAASAVARLDLDTDQDGTVDERLDLKSGTMVRR